MGRRPVEPAEVLDAILAFTLDDVDSLGSLEVLNGAGVDAVSVGSALRNRVLSAVWGALGCAAPSDG